MSQPFHPRVADHPPHDLNIEANVGVDLARSSGGYIVTPRYIQRPRDDDYLHAPFALPLLPARQVESMSRLLRAAWRAHQVCVCWALYLHLREHRWTPYLPPQWCDGEGVLVNLAYPRVTVPGPDLRLAGTYRSSTTGDSGLLAAELPPRDGLHLVWHPCSWIADAAFLTCGGATDAIPVHATIHDEPGNGHADLCRRLWIQTRT